MSEQKELIETAKALVLKLLPPEERGEDSDVEELWNILLELGEQPTTTNQQPAPADSIMVTREELQRFINEIREAKKFRADVEFDIGYVLESLATIDTSKIMKMLPRIIMGKIDIKDIGLDIDRIKAIGEKYAPQTAARLKEKATN